eukprot:1988240-Amphidinium_carterae.1
MKKKFGLKQPSSLDEISQFRRVARTCHMGIQSSGHSTVAVQQMEKGTPKTENWTQFPPRPLAATLPKTA